MSAQSVSWIVDRLHHAGLNLSLAPNGGLAVTPSSLLTSDLRDFIRNSKAQLIDWLTTANDPSSHASDLYGWGSWKELAAAYHAHQFNCLSCIAAGRGIVYGQRCEVGKVMWVRYQNADEKSI